MLFSISSMSEDSERKLSSITSIARTKRCGTVKVRRVAFVPSTANSEETSPVDSEEEGPPADFEGTYEDWWYSDERQWARLDLDPTSVTRQSDLNRNRWSVDDWSVPPYEYLETVGSLSRYSWGNSQASSRRFYERPTEISGRRKIFEQKS